MARISLLDLDAVKTILGITDTASDDVLTAALDPVTDIFENYCARGLAFNDAEVEEIFGITQRIPLYRFPVTTITEYKVNDVVETAPPLDKARGFLLPYYEDSRAVVQATTVSGYAVADVPADLANAFAYSVAAYANVTPVNPAPASSAPLKSLSLGSGALAVAFDTSTATGASYDASDAPTLLQPYAFTLRKYRVKDYV